MKVYHSELVASYVCVLPVPTVIPCKADAKTSISPIFNIHPNRYYLLRCSAVAIVHLIDWRDNYQDTYT